MNGLNLMGEWIFKAYLTGISKKHTWSAGQMSHKEPVKKPLLMRLPARPVYRQNQCKLVRAHEFEPGDTKPVVQEMQILQILW